MKREYVRSGESRDRGVVAGESIIQVMLESQLGFS